MVGTQDERNLFEHRDGFSVSTFTICHFFGYWRDLFTSFSLLLVNSVFLFNRSVHIFYLKLGWVICDFATFYFVKSSKLTSFLSPIWQSACEIGFFRTSYSLLRYESIGNISNLYLKILGYQSLHFCNKNPRKAQDPRVHGSFPNIA